MAVASGETGTDMAKGLVGSTEEMNHLAVFQEVHNISRRCCWLIALKVFMFVGAPLVIV